MLAPSRLAFNQKIGVTILRFEIVHFLDELQDLTTPTDYESEGYTSIHGFTDSFIEGYEDLEVGPKGLTISEHWLLLTEVKRLIESGRQELYSFYVWIKYESIVEVV